VSVNASPIPSTWQLLMSIKRPPKERTTIAKLESLTFWVLLALAVAMLAVAGLAALGWLIDTALRVAVFAVVVPTYLAVLFFAGLQVIDMVILLRTGQRRAAERVDADIARELNVIDELQACDATALRERSKHLELEAKRLTRRSGMATVLSALGVVTINLGDAGRRAALWGDSPSLALFVHAATLGLLLGAAALVLWTGKLERIAGLLGLAADRTATRTL